MPPLQQSPTAPPRRATRSRSCRPFLTSACRRTGSTPSHPRHRDQRSGCRDEPGPAAVPSWGVMLDIGGDTGALVVHATEALLGREVEVSPAAAGRKRVHAVVHERQAAGRRVFAAVFPSLGKGDYVLW